MNWERIVLHVDMNAYFASVEQKSNPLLRGKPLLVVADSRRRSVVMTASYEARKFGVKTGMNLYEARKYCPHAVVVDGSSEKYLDSTAQILNVLESFSDQVEMTSCDEAYLDVTRSQRCFGADGAGIAQMVKDKVRAVTGLPCSVGVASNKLLAKLASDKQKPDGLTVIAPERADEMLAQTPVEELCGVGRHLKVKLNMLGIKTCKEMGDKSLSFMQDHFGFWGYWLKRMGQGVDRSPVKKMSESQPVKSVGHSTTFPRDTSDPDMLKSFLMMLSEKVAVRLRRGRYQGSTVSLTVRYKDFTTFSRQTRRSGPTSDGWEIYCCAWQIMGRVGELVQPVRLLGVSVSDLEPDACQEFLFEAMSRRRRIAEINDSINKKFGAFTLRPARTLFAEQSGVLSPPIPPFMHKI